MSGSKIPFQIIDWTTIKPTEHRGETGTAHWRTLQYADLRIRIVNYSDGYLADHWCRKGHIVHCLKGEVITMQESGEEFILKEGMTYIVSDNLSSHRSVAKQSVELLILDGEFLQ
jgi:hypothetical protein